MCAAKNLLALPSESVTTDVQASVELSPLTGERRPISEWTTNFHLAIVALDPYTNESSWIIDTALRILRNYTEADVRVALLVTASEDEVRQYVGPLADEILVFADADRAAVKAFGLDSLPAFVHINQAHQVEASAQGWTPQEWAAVAANLSARMDWTVPQIPDAGDPSPFAGTPLHA